MLIAFTSDWHYPHGTAATVANLGARLAALNPTAVVVAGDAVEDTAVETLPRALALLRERYRGPLGFVCGNHELYVGREGPSSATLFDTLLPAIVRDAGAIWLEDDALDLAGGVRILGSVAWYDYSARSSETAAWSVPRIAAAKAHYSADAAHVRWPCHDITFAADRRRHLEQRLADSERDPEVRAVVLATHMPIFREQTTRTLETDPVTRSYFYHFPLGDAAARCRKLQLVVSGHTHDAVPLTPIDRPGLPPLTAAVLGAANDCPPILACTIDASRIPCLTA